MKEIFKRQSIREFTSQKVEKEKIEKILRAAMQAPSGGNQQPWEFLIIDDPEIIAKLPTISRPAAPSGRAPLDIIMLANSERIKHEGLWTHDLGACCENVLLEATHLGLGSVWMSIEPNEERIEKCREMFNLPENIKPFAIIAIGYPNETKEPVNRYDETRIHYNKF